MKQKHVFIPRVHSPWSIQDWKSFKKSPDESLSFIHAFSDERRIDWKQTRHVWGEEKKG
jgi:hypothetical protein